MNPTRPSPARPTNSGPSQFKPKTSAPSPVRSYPNGRLSEPKKKQVFEYKGSSASSPARQQTPTRKNVSEGRATEPRKPVAVTNSSPSARYAPARKNFSEAHSKESKGQPAQQKYMSATSYMRGKEQPKGGIVPIPRVPVRQQQSKLFSSTQELNVKRYGDLNETDLIKRQKSQLKMIKSYKTGGVNSFIAILLEGKFENLCESLASAISTGHKSMISQIDQIFKDQWTLINSKGKDQAAVWYKDIKTAAELYEKQLSSSD